MKKSKKSSKISLQLILKIAGIALGCIALIFLALPGISSSVSFADVVTTYHVNLAGFIFGGGTRVMQVGSADPVSAHYGGGMSIFALLAVVLLVAGIIVGALAIFKKHSTMAYTAAGLLLIAGISMFLLKVVGTPLTELEGIGVESSFAQLVDGMDLGIGAILYGVFAVISGCCIGVGNFLESK